MNRTLFSHVKLSIWAAALLHIGLGGGALLAQVNVTVNSANVVSALPLGGIGLHTSVYANQFGNAVVPSRIAESGVEMLRYPGGSYSDIYHWSNHTATGGYAASQSNFGRFAQIMEQAGTQGMVTINYGSSHQSTMGGQPKEAAAWVAYANGDASLYGTAADVSIGVDAEGNNWRTVGYWARLRTLTAAQNSDNQYDFLAINHDQPIGIKYWEIGNELNGAGYYSDIDSNWNWETDVHAPPGATRGNNPLLSPTAYGTNFNAFAAAMKAVDPSIKIGGVLTGLNGVGDVADQTRNWDRNVLTTAGVNMDFAVLHWYVNSNNSINTVLNATDDLPAFFQATRNKINTYVGPGEANRIDLHMTEFGYFGTLNNPIIDGVFAANTYATALADGVKSVHWLELSKDSFLGDAAAQTRGPVFHGIQAFSHIAQSGAEFVNTTSSNGNIEVHSTRLPDGRVGLLIANLNSSGASSVNVNVTGGVLAQSGTTWLYGVNQTTPLQTSLPSGLGNAFSVSVPYQSILTVLIDTAGDFNGNGVVDAADYVVWRKGLGTTFTQPDYDTWRTHFGQTAGSGLGANANVTVPEPTSLLLLVLATSCAFLRIARAA
jgi:hypothetical protein